MTILPIVLFTVIAFAVKNMAWPRPIVRISKFVLITMMVATVVALAFNGVRYLYFPTYYNFGEENVAAVAAYWLQGHPIYHSLSSADRYAMLYGPLPTIINGLFQKFEIDVFLASKLPGVISLFFTFYLMAAIAQKNSAWPTPKKMIILSSFAAVLIVYFTTSFWDRADSYVLWLTMLGVVLVENRGPEFITSILFGVVGACLANCKGNALLTIVPSFAFYLERKKPEKVLALTIAFTLATIATGLLVFTIPNVGLKNYLSIVLLAAHQPFALSMFCNNIAFILPFLALLLLTDFCHQNRRTFYAAIFSIALTIIAASKVGAGRHHLLPFLPLLFYFAAIAEDSLDQNRRENLRRYAVCVFLGLFWLVPQFEGRLLNFYYGRGQRSIAQLSELRTLEKAYPGPKSMGAGDTNDFNLSYFSPELVNNGGRLFVDVVAIVDFRTAHLAMPSSTYKDLAACKVQDFVLPSTGLPWTVSIVHQSSIFSDRFRRIFSLHYKRLATVGQFALYRCLSPN